MVGHNPTGQQPTFAVIFPFFTASQTTQLIREYAQGPNRVLLTLASGRYEPQKHAAMLDCARAELAEEMQLVGGEWSCLLQPGHEGIAELKWGTNTFVPYLVIDPQQARGGEHKLDAEEYIEIQPRTTTQELMQEICAGKLMLPAV